MAGLDAEMPPGPYMEQAKLFATPASFSLSKEPLKFTIMRPANGALISVSTTYVGVPETIISLFALKANENVGEASPVPVSTPTPEPAL